MIEQQIDDVQPSYKKEPIQKPPFVLTLGNLVDKPDPESRILPIPFDFEYEPVEVLSKQLTKLNSPHPYRMVYLGPRWASSIALHKKYAADKQQADNTVPNSYAYDGAPVKKYPFEFNKMAKTSSFMDAYHQRQYYKTSIYYRAFQGMNPTLEAQESPIFDASFQSSNLDCVVKVTDLEYDLFLRIDSNTNGHIQWFYFTVRNRNQRKLQFNICNLMKAHTLYQKVNIAVAKRIFILLIGCIAQNMKPYIFSKKKHVKTGATWHQDGKEVTFEQKRLRYDFIYQKARVGRQLYKLSWIYEFEFEQDQVSFAYGVPYTYSQMLRDVHGLPKTDDTGNKIMQINSMCRSLMGLEIPILRITDDSVPCEEKKIVIANGRIHPGQSNGSIVTLGLLQYLCSKQAALVRKRAVFLIIPMLNPDGVVVGNYRTGIIGKDLNRQFANPTKQLYPEIIALKKLVAKINKQMPKNKVHMYLDFHGHSQKKNTFVYGPSYSISQPNYYKSKILPKLVSQKTDMFRYYSCIFKITEEKQSTARAVMFHNLGIPYTFTIQSSNGFYYNPDTLQTYQFNKAKWVQMGRKFAEGLHDYFQYTAEYEAFLAARRKEKQARKTERESRLQHKSSRKNMLPSDSNSNLRASVNLQAEAPPAPAAATLPPQGLNFLSLIQQIKNDDDFQKYVKEDDIFVDSDSDNQKDQLNPLKADELNKLLINDSLKLSASAGKQIDNSSQVNRVLPKSDSEIMGFESPEKQKQNISSRRKPTSKTVNTRSVSSKHKKSATTNRKSKPRNLEDDELVGEYLDTEMEIFNQVSSKNNISSNPILNSRFESRARSLCKKNSSEQEFGRGTTGAKSKIERPFKKITVTLIRNQSGRLVQPQLNYAKTTNNFASGRESRNVSKDQNYKKSQTTPQPINFAKDLMFPRELQMPAPIPPEHKIKPLFKREKPNSINRQRHKDSASAAPAARQKVEGNNVVKPRDFIRETIQQGQQAYRNPHLILEHASLKQSQTNLNFTKLVYMMNHTKEQSRDEYNLLSCKVPFPVAFYRIKQQIQSKKKNFQHVMKDKEREREEELQQQLTEQTDYLKIRKY